MQTIDRRIGALDYAYLGLTVGTFAVAGFAILLAGPDSWFHREKSSALALGLGALTVAGFLNLAIAASRGRIWTKHGAVYRTDHPKLFATHRVLTRVIMLVAVGMAVALLFFLPPL